MEGSTLSITYNDRRMNICIRKRTQFINIMEKMEWSWTGHNNRLNDDWWTSRVKTSRPNIMTRKDNKRWRDDLDTHWMDTIWQNCEFGSVVNDRTNATWHAIFVAVDQVEAMITHRRHAIQLHIRPLFPFQPNIEHWIHGIQILVANYDRP